MVTPDLVLNLQKTNSCVCVCVCFVLWRQMDVMLAQNQREHQQRALNTHMRKCTQTRATLHCAYLYYCPVRRSYCEL